MKQCVIWLLLLSCVIAMQTVLAQPRGEARAEEQLQTMKNVVGLSDAQMKEIRAIMKKSREEVRKEFESTSGDRSSMREMMIKRVEKTDEQIIKVLTKKQLPKYEQYKKERQKETQDRMRERQ